MSLRSRWTRVFDVLRVAAVIYLVGCAIWSWNRPKVFAVMLLGVTLGTLSLIDSRVRHD